MTINYDIIREIYNPLKLKEEIYTYLCSVIDDQLTKKDDADDALISDCVKEIIRIDKRMDL